MAGYGLYNFSVQNHTASVIGCTAAQAASAAKTPWIAPAWFSQFDVNPQPVASTVYPEPLGQGQGNMSNNVQAPGEIEPANLILVENNVLVLSNYAHWM